MVDPPDCGGCGSGAEEERQQDRAADHPEAAASGPLTHPPLGMGPTRFCVADALATHNAPDAHDHDAYFNDQITSRLPVRTTSLLWATTRSHTVIVVSMSALLLQRTVTWRSDQSVTITARKFLTGSNEYLVVHL